jgi:multidrug efflux system outer membrane protein
MKMAAIQSIVAGYGRNMLFAGLLFTVAGCAVGPDYVAPALDLPKQYDAAPHAAPSDRADSWWASFDDAVLTECIQEALRHNQDIRVSAQRIRIARAMRRMESSRFYPDIDAKLSYTVDRLSENNPRFEDAISAGIFPKDVEYWDAGFDVNWEIDVFGGARRRVEGAVARIEQEAFQQVALVISVSAEVARNYFEIRGNQHRLAILDAQIENEASRIRILQNKHRSGLIPASQIINSQARRQELQSLKPTVQADIQAGRYRLAVLMGRRPEEAIPGLDKTQPLPSSDWLVPVGLPSELLRRRPDIRASERKLAAATADLGVAETEFWPRFFLTGSPGLQSGNFVDLFSSSSAAWVFGPKITWNLFSGNRNKAQLETANAIQTQALIEYEATVNKALEDVESNLVRYVNNALSLRFVIEVMNSRRRDLEIQTIRHNSGLTDALAVAASKVAWLDSQRSHLEWQVNLLTRVVALYKSLGGGWEDTPEMSSTDTIEP